MQKLKAKENTKLSFLHLLVILAWIFKIFFFRYDVENNTIQSIPDPLPRQDVAEVPQPPKENLRILCCAISQNSEFVAFADDHKQVTVWSWKDGSQLNLVRQWNMLRRANKIIFDRDATSILIAGNKMISPFAPQINGE